MPRRQDFTPVEAALVRKTSTPPIKGQADYQVLAGTLCLCKRSNSCLFISSCFLALSEVHPPRLPVTFHPFNPSGIPKSFSVFNSTTLYSSLFSLSKQNGCFNDTGGLVITLGVRKRFFEAVCNINGCRRYTSPTSPVASKKLSSLVNDGSRAIMVQKPRPSEREESLTDFIQGVVPSGWSYCITG